MISAIYQAMKFRYSGMTFKCRREEALVSKLPPHRSWNLSFSTCSWAMWRDWICDPTGLSCKPLLLFLWDMHLVYMLNATLLWIEGEYIHLDARDLKDLLVAHLPYDSIYPFLWLAISILCYVFRYISDFITVDSLAHQFFNHVYLAARNTPEELELFMREIGVHTLSCGHFLKPMANFTSWPIVPQKGTKCTTIFWSFH